MKPERNQFIQSFVGEIFTNKTLNESYNIHTLTSKANHKYTNICKSRNFSLNFTNDHGLFWEGFSAWNEKILWFFTMLKKSLKLLPEVGNFFHCKNIALKTFKKYSAEVGWGINPNNWSKFYQLCIGQSDLSLRTMNITPD